jgi:hypothetical protein
MAFLASVGPVTSGESQLISLSLSRYLEIQPRGLHGARDENEQKKKSLTGLESTNLSVAPLLGVIFSDDGRDITAGFAVAMLRRHSRHLGGMWFGNWALRETLVSKAGRGIAIS